MIKCFVNGLILIVDILANYVIKIHLGHGPVIQGHHNPLELKTGGRTTPKFTFFRGCAPLSIQTVDQSLVPNGEFFYSKEIMEKKLKHF